jgi:signal transduction histidine kinase
LVVAPLAMAWARPRAASWPWRRGAEGVLVLAAVAGVSVIALSTHQPVTYAVFPALLWAALRLGPQGATLALGIAAGIAVWMTANELGALVVHSPTSSALNLQLYITVAALTTLSFAAIVAERRQAAVEVVESRARIAEAGDRERRKLERDLHDGAQQRLMAIQIKLRLVEQRVRDPELAAKLDEISDDAAASVEELRALAHGIYPPALWQFGLVAAMRHVAMTAHIPIEIVDEGIGRCSPSTEVGALDMRVNSELVPAVQAMFRVLSGRRRCVYNRRTRSGMPVARRGPSVRMAGRRRGPPTDVRPANRKRPRPPLAQTTCRAGSGHERPELLKGDVAL